MALLSQVLHVPTGGLAKNDGKVRIGGTLLFCGRHAGHFVSLLAPVNQVAVGTTRNLVRSVIVRLQQFCKTSVAMYRRRSLRLVRWNSCVDEGSTTTRALARDQG